MKLSYKLQCIIDMYFWRPIYYGSAFLIAKYPDPYQDPPKWLSALNEAAWNRVCGGSTSAWVIFRIAMGWDKNSKVRSKKC